MCCLRQHWKIGFVRIEQRRYLRIMIVIAVLAGLAGCAAQGPYLRLDSSLVREIGTFSGTEYIPLIRLCDFYSLDCKWDSFIKAASLHRGANRVVLMVGSDRALVNGVERKMDRPVILEGGVVMVPVSFAKNNMGQLVGMVTAERPPEVTVSKKFTIKTIVLDAGHGGKDPGALSRRSRLREKDMNLTIAKKLKSILEDNGIKVVMTRSNDTFIPLPKRSKIANQSGADLFVSIHINASRSRSMRGFECYYLSSATDDNARALEAIENSSLKLSDEADAEHSRALDKTLWDMVLTENRMESAELAGQICDSAQRNLNINNRGIRTARFYVLKHTNIPSVLVEVGYISNKHDELEMRGQGRLEKIAEALAKGILRYKLRYEETEGFTKS